MESLRVAVALAAMPSMLACSHTSPATTRDAPDSLVDATPADAAAVDAAGGPTGPCALGAVPANATVVNVPARYGSVTLATIAQAIADAKTHFISEPGTTYVLQFPAATYDLSTASVGNGAFDVSAVAPGTGGRLIITGAGKTLTTFVLADTQDGFYGRNAANVCFVGMHVTWQHETVSQGHVVSTAPGEVVLDIQAGFPTPADIFEANPNIQGRYLRQYTDDLTNPRLVNPTTNDQVPWATATQVSGQRWRLALNNPNGNPGYTVGALLGIKSKHGGNAGIFFASANLIFNDVRWTRHSRLTFRTGTAPVEFWNSDIVRSPAINGQTPCLSTPEGGPQLGQPGDAAITGMVINGFNAESTGDDSIALFNAMGTINNAHLSNAFSARCILLNASTAQIDDVTKANIDHCAIVTEP